MKPVRRRLRSQSNGYAEIGFPFIFIDLARGDERIAVLVCLRAETSLPQGARGMLLNRLFLR